MAKYCKQVWRGARKGEIEVDAKVEYQAEEVDPIRCTEPGKKSYCLVRNWESRRAYWGLDVCQPTHIVLGPDLASEGIWRSLVKKDPGHEQAQVQLPKNNIIWNVDKVPTKISKPKEIKFKLANGTEIVFCTGTKGKFRMSNISGQDKQFHKVEITRPFWISKYLVTVGQWRDFGRYDYEGLCRDIEKCFAKEKFPICARSNWYQWMEFCKFLTKRYGNQLPQGYVFRLPTEAELEWSYIANSYHTVEEIDFRPYNRWNENVAADFLALLKKKRIPESWGISMGGYCDQGQCLIAGRATHNAWGLYDIFDEVPTIETCDEYPIKDGKENWRDGYPEQCILYGDTEVDPIRVAMPFANKYISRWGVRGRRLRPFDMSLPCRIVIGPEIEQAKLNELYGPYPTCDFDGELINSQIRLESQSSVDVLEWNSLECHKSLLSTEPVMDQIFNKRKRCYGFHTKEEPAPWVQFVLAEPRVINGIRLENLNYKGQTEHIRVWISTDGKRWREVAQENKILCRYMFDLRKKAVLAKYIRVWREAGIRTDSFALNKILVYGKK